MKIVFQPIDGRLEVARRQRVLHPAQAARVGDRERQQQPEDADGHDPELDDVRHRQRPHAAGHAVEDDDAARDQDRDRGRDVEQAVEDGARRDRRRHRDHQRVRGHDRRADDPRRHAVALGHQLRHGVDAGLDEPPREQHAEPDQPEADHDHEPRAGDAVLITEADRADRRRAAEHDRAQRADEHGRAEPSPRHEVVVSGAGPPEAPVRGAEHDGEVDGDDDGVEHAAKGPRCVRSGT